MINAKVKIFNEDYESYLEDSVNQFLKTIDVRQILKTEYSSSMAVGGDSVVLRSYSAIIYYVELADVRDIKIDNVLEIK
jgi:predicted RNase H-related nuclease YkuK (DUF458 family)